MSHGPSRNFCSISSSKRFTTSFKSLKTPNNYNQPVFPTKDEKFEFEEFYRPIFANVVYEVIRDFDKISLNLNVFDQIEKTKVLIRVDEDDDEKSVSLCDISNEINHVNHVNNNNSHGSNYEKSLIGTRVYSIDTTLPANTAKLVTNQLNQIYCPFLTSTVTVGNSCSFPSSTITISKNPIHTKSNLYNQKLSQIDQINSNAKNRIYFLKDSNLKIIKENAENLPLITSRYIDSYLEEKERYLDEFIEKEIILRIDNLARRKRVMVEKAYIGSSCKKL